MRELELVKGCLCAPRAAASPTCRASDAPPVARRTSASRWPPDESAPPPAAGGPPHCQSSAARASPQASRTAPAGPPS